MVVSSDTRDPQFRSRHQQIYLRSTLLKSKTGRKRGRKWPILKTKESYLGDVLRWNRKSFFKYGPQEMYLPIGRYMWAIMGSWKKLQLSRWSTSKRRLMMCFMDIEYSLPNKVEANEKFLQGLLTTAVNMSFWDTVKDVYNPNN